MAYEIRVPRLGWSMEEGTFVRWLKQAGETVAAGELLFEIEGEKALQEVESVDAGTLYIPPDAPQPGTAVAVGGVLGYLLAPGESAPTSSPVADQPDAVGQLKELPTVAQQGIGDSAALPAAGPAVRRLARELGVDLADVTPGDKTGRISRRGRGFCPQKAERRKRDEHRAAGDVVCRRYETDRHSPGQTHRRGVGRGLDGAGGHRPQWPHPRRRRPSSANGSLAACCAARSVVRRARHAACLPAARRSPIGSAPAAT